jgi:hypothetical protein
MATTSGGAREDRARQDVARHSGSAAGSDRMTVPHVDRVGDSPTDDVIHVALPQRLIIRCMSAFAVLLVIAHLVFSVNRYMLHYQFLAADNLYVLFDLWDEVSIPSWYSASLLLVCAALLGVIAVERWRSRDRYRVHWVALAIIFLGLSVDDAADVHGHASYKLHETLDTGGFLAYAWVIPAAALTLIFVVAYIPFLRHLPRAVALRFIIAGALFVGGALGMEMIQARYDTLHGVENMPYRIMVAIEEGMEMAGTILFISVLMSYLRGLSNTIQLRISAR